MSWGLFQVRDLDQQLGNAGRNLSPFWLLEEGHFFQELQWEPCKSIEMLLIRVKTHKPRPALQVPWGKPQPSDAPLLNFETLPLHPKSHTEALYISLCAGLPLFPFHLERTSHKHAEQFSSTLTQDEGILALPARGRRTKMEMPSELKMDELGYKAGWFFHCPSQYT